MGVVVDVVGAPIRSKLLLDARRKGAGTVRRLPGGGAGVVVGVKVGVGVGRNRHFPAGRKCGADDADAAWSTAYAHRRSTVASVVVRARVGSNGGSGYRSRGGGDHRLSQRNADVVDADLVAGIGVEVEGVVGQRLGPVAEPLAEDDLEGKDGGRDNGSDDGEDSREGEDVRVGKDRHDLETGAIGEVLVACRVGRARVRVLALDADVSGLDNKDGNSERNRDNEQGEDGAAENVTIPLALGHAKGGDDRDCGGDDEAGESEADEANAFALCCLVRLVQTILSTDLGPTSQWRQDGGTLA